MSQIPSKTRSGWLRAALIAGVFCIAVLLLVGLFLLHRPETLQPVLEKFLSAASGFSIRYESLMLNLDSSVVEIEDLRISSGRSIRDLEISIPRVQFQYRLSGAFTDRVLVLQTVRIHPDRRRRRDNPSRPDRVFSGRCRPWFFHRFVFRRCRHPPAPWSWKPVQAGFDFPSFLCIWTIPCGCGFRASLRSIGRRRN